MWDRLEAGPRTLRSRRPAAAALVPFAQPPLIRRPAGNLTAEPCDAEADTNPQREQGRHLRGVTKKWRRGEEGRGFGFLRGASPRAPRRRPHGATAQGWRAGVSTVFGSPWRGATRPLRARGALGITMGGIIHKKKRSDSLIAPAFDALFDLTPFRRLNLVVVRSLTTPKRPLHPARPKTREWGIQASPALPSVTMGGKPQSPLAAFPPGRACPSPGPNGRAA